MAAKTMKLLVIGGFTRKTNGGFFIYDSFIAKSQINPDTVEVCTDSATEGWIIEIPMWLAKKVNVTGMAVENYPKWANGAWEPSNIDAITIEK